MPEPASLSSEEEEEEERMEAGGWHRGKFLTRPRPSKGCMSVRTQHNTLRSDDARHVGRTFISMLLLCGCCSSNQ